MSHAECSLTVFDQRHQAEDALYFLSSLVKAGKLRENWQVKRIFRKNSKQNSIADCVVGDRL